MTDKPWRVSDADDVEHAVVIVDGKETKVANFAPFVETISTLAKEAGLKKITVKVDGNEIEFDNAPDNFSDIEEVVVAKYDEGS